MFFFQMACQKYLFILVLFVINPSQKLWTLYIGKISFLTLQMSSLEKSDYILEVCHETGVSAG